MIFDKSQTVREIAITHPAAVRVFENLGIDYCCGGKRPLGEACERAHVPLEAAMQQLGELQINSASPDEDHWMAVPLGVLAAHIVNRHHRYVREETPRVDALLRKVVGRHGKARPEVEAIAETFGALSQELFAHMMKEEHVLFPFFDQLDRVMQDGPAPTAGFPSVEFPIARMLADHDDAGALIAKIRDLSSGYQVPDGACPTYRGLYHALEEFARDLHQHIHLENNILFPRAVQAERSLQVAAYVGPAAVEP